MNKANDRYTESARRALRIAGNAAAAAGAGYIGTEHILLGLLKESGGAAGAVMRDRGAAPEKLEKLIGELITAAQDETDKKRTYSPRAEQILQAGVLQAADLGMELVGTEHILLAMLEDIECTGTRLLHTMGVDVPAMYRTLLDVADADPARSRDLNQNIHISGEMTFVSTPSLDQYATDLTRRAAEGQMDAIIGREAETERLMQVLSRRTKNNPCLIGEPGVGKTAIVEGLAQRIVRGEVPEHLRGKRLLSLDMAGMVAGTKYRGEFEERMKKVIGEAVQSKEVLLFIDEIHTIIGAGGAEGSLDASNMMKPYLSRGQLQLIGATTVGEYRKYIEKDAALERRFQSIMVEEPSEAETIRILTGLKEVYEKHHGVSITGEALESAAALSKRYINDRFLPDKAIDLLDEACAKRQMSTYPQRRAEDEQETDELAQIREQLERAIFEGELDQARALRVSLKEKQQEKEKREAQRRRKMSRGAMTVTGEDIAATVSLWTGIPASRIDRSEGRRLLQLDKELHKRIIGQDEAVQAVAKAIRRGRAGLKDPRRPIGSFLFLGPTGVGKTELSKALADAVFGSEQSIIRVDMTEYMEKHSVSKMVGSPPGYVGHEEGGQLSEKVRRHPYSVILFDEIEKAHPDVFNILLQVLDEGHITDSQGRKVDFKNTILIMTSNAGAASTQNPKRLGFGTVDTTAADYQKMKDGVMESVKQIFKPEFLNRIDDTIVFHSLTKEDIRQITRLMLSELSARCMEQMHITLKLQGKVIEEIAKSGYDEKYGARPIRRAIQTRIEDPLAEEILSGRAKSGDTVKVSLKEDKIVFKTASGDAVSK